MKEVSVIIPVYNSGETLGTCIDSILKQSFDDFELLLIDDGSTDNSLNLCYGFASADSRIKVFSQENKGVSAARNKGLANALGNYIVFVDSDDYVLPEYLMSLYCSIKESGVDLVVQNALNISADNLPLNSPVFSASELIPYSDVSRWLNHLLLEPGCGSKIFKSSIICENSLRFNDVLKIGEDTLFIVEFAALATNGFWFQPIANYCYVQSPNSLMSNYRNGNYNASLQAIKLFARSLAGHTFNTINLPSVYGVQKQMIFFADSVINNIVIAPLAIQRQALQQLNNLGVKQYMYHLKPKNPLRRLFYTLLFRNLFTAAALVNIIRSRLDKDGLVNKKVKQ